jgi:hypothetical protein
VAVLIAVVVHAIEGGARGRLWRGLQARGGGGAKALEGAGGKAKAWVASPLFNNTKLALAGAMAGGFSNCKPSERVSPLIRDRPVSLQVRLGGGTHEGVGRSEYTSQSWA